MKSGVNYVPLSRIIQAAQVMGLTVVEQKGFVKITGPTAGRVLYPGNTKLVGRIDVSGWGEKIPDGCVPHPKPPTKRVTALVDQTKAENAVYATLINLFKDLGGAIPKVEEPEMTEAELEAATAPAPAEEPKTEEKLAEELIVAAADQAAE